MANLINETERVKKQMQMGWPDGTSELHRDIPTLFRRIEELENALVPFAHVALIERNTSNDRLVSVYLKHCRAAMEKIDKNQSAVRKMDDFFSMPAGG